jgi:uncharacterized membrane protein
MANPISGSLRLMVLGVILTLVGCFMIIVGFTYRDEAKHEATTPGVIVRVIHGKSTTYDYVFRVNGIKMNDSGGACKTPLTSDGCREGGQVLVYYGYEPTTSSMLEDFADAAREKLQLGAVLSSVGLLMVGVSLLMRKFGTASDSSEDDHDSSNHDDSEVISIAPRD